MTARRPKGAMRDDGTTATDAAVVDRAARPRTGAPATPAEPSSAPPPEGREAEREAMPAPDRLAGARTRLTVGGVLRETVDGYRLLRATKYGAAPLVVLTVVDFVQAFDNAIFTLVLPDVRRHFGVSLTLIVTLGSIVSFFALLSAPLIGFLADRVRRTLIVGVSAVVSGFFSMISGAAPNVFGLQLARGVDEVGERFGDIPTRALFTDYYPIEARGKAFALKELALRGAQLAAPATVGYLAVRFGWRAPFYVVGPLLVATGLYAVLRLREPVRGYWERLRLGTEEAAAAQEEEAPGWAEGVRTLFAIRTLRRLFVAAAVTAAGGVGFLTLYPFFLAEKFHLDAFQRGLLQTPANVAGLVGIILGGVLTDVLVRRRPGRVLLLNGIIGAIGAAAHALIVVVPNLAVVATIGVVIVLSTSILSPALFTLFSLVIPPRMRAQGLGFVGLILAPAVLIVQPLAGYLGDRYGIEAGMLVFVPIMAIASLLAASAGNFFELDMRSAIAVAAATDAYRKAKAAGDVRLLVCRDVDVHYDSVQVLFGVDLVVDEGEIVALLGTNGAGKSTLLRAISGTQHASSGAILFDGKDITHLPPHEIPSLGVVHMPGGRAVFPSLTVRENLDLALGDAEDGADTEARLEEVFGYFPVLRRRLGDEAGLLSGGEQQMVGLAQAFLARPRLLMIDELSLGLAPAVVQELLGIVEAIHAQGTTIILVEQSVNVALTVARRAVFMEKGEVRFDGDTRELLTRPDIMRAVYLKGSAALTEGPARVDRSARTAERGRPILALEGVTRSFGGITAVDDVSLVLHEGEALGLIGPNGAGKTTLFDVISGFTPPDDGTIVLDGVDVTKLPPAERARRGLIRRFQDARIFSSLTVSEAVAVALERQLEVRNTFVTALQLPAVRRGEARVRARSERLIEMLELGAYRDKFVSELSTGLRRVVDLALVLAAEPKVLLLDEPSAGVAQAEAEGLAPLLGRIRFETGCSLLVIEHDMPLISAVSDELVALVQGAVVTRGRPDDVLAHPRVVEAYLGTREETLRRSGVLKG